MLEWSVWKKYRKLFGGAVQKLPCDRFKTATDAALPASVPSHKNLS